MAKKTTRKTKKTKAKKATKTKTKKPKTKKKKPGALSVSDTIFDILNTGQKIEMIITSKVNGSETSYHVYAKEKYDVIHNNLAKALKKTFN